MSNMNTCVTRAAYQRKHGATVPWQNCCTNRRWYCEWHAWTARESSSRIVLTQQQDSNRDYRGFRLGSAICWLASSLVEYSRLPLRWWVFEYPGPVSGCFIRGWRELWSRLKRKQKRRGCERTKIRLIKGNAKCRHLKNWLVRTGTMRQVFICRVPEPLTPLPLHTL